MCKQVFNVTFWHFYLKDAISDEKQAWEFSWEQKDSLQQNRLQDRNVSMSRKHQKQHYTFLFFWYFWYDNRDFMLRSTLRKQIKSNSII